MHRLLIFIYVCFIPLEVGVILGVFFVFGVFFKKYLPGRLGLKGDTYATILTSWVV